MRAVFAEVGSGFQQIGGTCPPGWIEMQGERPTPEHVAQADGAWLRDGRTEIAAERVWRDAEISSVEWMRDRHRDQVEVGVQTTLTAAQYIELLRYIQSLRDWPQSAAFPTPADRPQPPEWLAGQVADAA